MIYIMSTKIIKTYWESFRNEVISKDAPEVQLKEMEKAFYGGAVSLFRAMTVDAIANPDQESANLFFDNLDKELQEYGVRLLEEVGVSMVPDSETIQ